MYFLIEQAIAQLDDLVITLSCIGPNKEVEDYMQNLRADLCKCREYTRSQDIDSWIPDLGAIACKYEQDLEQPPMWIEQWIDHLRQTGQLKQVDEELEGFD